MTCSCCRHFTGLLLICAAALSIVAVSTAHWSDYRQDSDTADKMITKYNRKTIQAYKGLWKACQKLEATRIVCVNVNRALSTEIPVWWRIVQIIEVLSAIFCLVAFMLWGCCFSCTKNGTEKSVRCSKILTCLLCLLSAACHGIGIVLWIMNERHALDRYETYGYGWSLWCAVAAASVAFLACLSATLSHASSSAYTHTLHC